MSSITLQGLVATTPRHIVTFEGLAITSFRLAEHKPNDTSGVTNWYTITSFRELGINTASSVSKGDRVVVSGSLKIRDWDNGERTGTSVEMEATAIGHDLNFGTSEFSGKQETAKHACSCNNCGKEE